MFVVQRILHFNLPKYFNTGSTQLHRGTEYLAGKVTPNLFTKRQMVVPCFVMRWVWKEVVGDTQFVEQ